MPATLPGSSADTRLVQEKLNSFPSALPKLAVDGIFGPKTRARTMEFQKQEGLVADGIVGSRTRAALGISAAPATPKAPTAPAAPGSGAGAQVVGPVLSAFTSAVDMWKLTARFSGIIVNGVTATGAPGCLTGPELAPLMTGRLPAFTGDDKAIASAAAKGISVNFEGWQSGVTIPGLPWYPSFAAVPGPVAPPTPNVPSPMMMLVSRGLAGMMDPTLLMAAMATRVSDSLRAPAMGTFFAIASSVIIQFQSRVLMSQVKLVLGSGPVPTFAPPYVPVGPVVGGTASSPPGALL